MQFVHIKSENIAQEFQKLLNQNVSGMFNVLQIGQGLRLTNHYCIEFLDYALLKHAAVAQFVIIL